MQKELLVPSLTPSLGSCPNKDCEACGDFQINKKISEEVAAIPSKRLRNKIAGYVTRIMKRIKVGSSVRGISLKLQEVFFLRRKQDVMPDRSVTEPEGAIPTDKDTIELLKYLKVNIPVSLAS